MFTEPRDGKKIVKTAKTEHWYTGRRCVNPIMSSLQTGCVAELSGQMNVVTVRLPTVRFPLAKGAVPSLLRGCGPRQWWISLRLKQLPRAALLTLTSSRSSPGGSPAALAEGP